MPTPMERAQVIKTQHDETLALTEKLASSAKKSGKLSQADEAKLAELKKPIKDRTRGGEQSGTT